MTLRPDASDPEMSDPETNDPTIEDPVIEPGLPSEPDQDVAPPAPRKRSVYWRPPGSTTGAGRFVTVTLAGTIGVLGVLIATSISILLNRDRWTSGIGSDLAPFVLGWLAGVGFAVVGMGALTGIAWMVWQHRAHANRAALVEGALKPAVVWWWLVPVASVFMPYVAIRDLARGQHDRPLLRKWWWASYLLFGIVSGLATILPFYIAEGPWQEWVSILSYAIGIVAAVLAIRVVRLIDAGLEDGRQREGWPTGWKPISASAQILCAVGGAAAASVGALLMGMVFPQLLDEMARAEAGTTVTNDFSVGTCFDHTTADYAPLSCDGPHGAEAYAKLTYPDQDAYPGQEEFESWAEPLCYGRFEGYTGIRYEESSLDFGYLYPGIQGWGAGDHEVICYLFDPSGNDLTEPIDTGSGTA
jgi:putative regulator of septum formation/uncharacterized protein DUF4328